MANHIDNLITNIIKAEGAAAMTNDPRDGGGRTKFGISEKSNAQAWLDGDVSEEEARAIYLKKYVEAPGFVHIQDPKLQHFLVDWGVTSGPGLAIKALQRAVDVEDDGILGNATLSALASRDAVVVLRQLIKERILQLGRIVQKDKGQAKFLVGWLSRTLEFL